MSKHQLNEDKASGRNYAKAKLIKERERFVMKINDELLERLGTYFVYHAVYENYGITF